MSSEPKLKFIIMVLLALGNGCVMILINPSIRPFALLDIPTLILYIYMIIIGAWMAIVCSGIEELLVVVLWVNVLSFTVFTVGISYAFGGIGGPVDLLSAWVVRPIIGYLVVAVLFQSIGLVLVSVVKS